jgi:hypothetical protein
MVPALHKHRRWLPFFNMRHVLTTILSICLLTTFAQDKHLIGTYSDTLSTPKLFISIQENGKFSADEFTEEGKRTLIGTWTFQNDTIRLRTAKIWGWLKESPNEKKEVIPKEFPDTLISVDNKKRLTLLMPAKYSESNEIHAGTRLKKIK